MISPLLYSALPQFFLSSLLLLPTPTKLRLLSKRLWFHFVCLCLFIGMLTIFCIATLWNFTIMILYPRTRLHYILKGQGQMKWSGKIKFHHLNLRWGRLSYIQGTSARQRKKTLITHNSFTHNGPRLFNCLPQALRDPSGRSGSTTESFKKKLDKWLCELPDQPPTTGYTSRHHNTLP